jgi:hypothetical protein
MAATRRMAVIALALAFAAVPSWAQKNSGAQIRSTSHGRSAPLRSYRPTQGKWHPGMPPRVIPLRHPRPSAKGGGSGKPGGGGSGGGGGNWSDADLQTNSYPQQYTVTDFGASSTQAFQGIGMTGDIPPDDNLSVGVNNGSAQIVQVVNTSYAIYDASGNTLTGGGDLGAALFSALPSTANCNANADGGDPVVLWDQQDKRWLISQLAYNSDFSQNDFCLAISDNSDATGSYEVYDIPFGNQVPDYPKLAVWGDGIYFSANMFKIKVNRFTGAETSTFLGAQACSFPLPSGNSVTFTCLTSLSTAIYNILPADIEGASQPPPTGTGGDYYLQFLDNLSATSGNDLRLYQFQSGALVDVGDLAVAAFREACGGGTCIPQLGTTQQLDSLGDRLMYRLSYRNYGTTQEMVVNQSVQVSSASQQTGIRWYELCSQAGPPPFTVCKQGTFSPNTTATTPGPLYRWMGSIAQDSAGNLGLGYSTSSSSTYPSVAITGMESAANGGADDGGMENEIEIFPGPNFQDTYSRWGDYSGMAVDPNDDCTFWYTNEYSTTTNFFGIYNFFWGTVIGSFHFPNCLTNNP